MVDFIQKEIRVEIDSEDIFLHLPTAPDEGFKQEILNAFRVNSRPRTPYKIRVFKDGILIGQPFPKIEIEQGIIRIYAPRRILSIISAPCGPLSVSCEYPWDRKAWEQTMEKILSDIQNYGDPREI